MDPIHTAREEVPSGQGVCDRGSMRDHDQDDSEARRLERLWATRFGNDYVDRNTAFDHRASFWDERLAAMRCDRVLEVGCNTGGNLQWILETVPPGRVTGVDINQKALTVLRHRLPAARAIRSSARHLPFPAARFDLVFTMGVLIHQPEESLRQVMAEMVRCSTRWILCGEYHASETVDIRYRGEEGALFKRDYGRLFTEWFPQLTIDDQGFLGRDDGWDDVTWWVLAKT